jgi:hypothetical protein
MYRLCKPSKAKIIDNLRKTAVFLLLLALFCSLLPGEVQAAEDNQKRQVIVVVCDYLKMDDINNKTELSNLHDLFGGGSIALLNTNTAAGRSRHNIAATISAGQVALSPTSEPLVFGPRETIKGEDPMVLFTARTGVEPEQDNLVVLDIPSIQLANESNQGGAKPGALADALHQEGLKTAAIGNSDLPSEFLTNRSMAMLAMDKKGIIDQGNVSEEVLNYDPNDPLGYRTDYSELERIYLQLQPETDLVVIDLGDLVRLEKIREQLTTEVYNQEREKILQKYDDYIGFLMQKTDLSNSMVLAITTTPTDDKSSSSRFFGFIAAQGEGMQEGLLATPTTRQTGIITLTDIAPSIASYLQAPFSSTTGRAWHVVPEENNLSVMQNIQERIIFASYLRPSMVKGYVFIHLLVMAGILFFMFFDPKKALYLIPLPLALLAVPLTWLLLGFLPNANIWLYLLLCVVIVTALVLLSLLLARNRNFVDPLIFLCIATVLGILLDTVTGGYLQKYAVLSYDPMGGARYYGIGNEYMGVLLGASIVGVSLLVQRLNTQTIYQYLITGIVFISVLVVLGAPWWGSNFGGFTASLIAFIFTFLRLLRIHIRPRNIIIALGVVGVLCLGVFIFDYMRPPELRSHFGQFAAAVHNSGFSVIIDTVVRKISMNYKLIRSTIWIRVLLSSLLALGILFYRPVGLFRSLLTKNPAIAAGLAGAVLGAFMALLFNDSGIVAAATAIIFPAATLFYLVLKELAASHDF